MAEFKLNHIVDTRRIAYRGFFDHSWFSEIDAIVGGTPLDPIVFDLSVGWRAASNTFRQPWLMVEQAQHLNEGRAEVQERFERFDPRLVSRLKNVANRMTADIGSEYAGEISARALQGIQTYLTTTLTTAQNAAAVAVLNSDDRDALWESYLKTQEFRINIIGSQPLAYTAVFFAYEDFVAQCYRLVTGDWEYDVDRTFWGKLSATFPDKVINACWGHPDVQSARKVRNAFAHHGGRVRTRMLHQKHPVRVHDGRFQVMPDNTRHLFNSLKGRAIILAREAVRLVNERRA